MYSYSSKCPPGFSPQFLQGNHLYFKPEILNSQKQATSGYDIEKGPWSKMMGSISTATDNNIAVNQPIPGAGNTQDLYNQAFVANWATTGNSTPLKSGSFAPNFDSEGQFNLVDPKAGNYLLFGGAVGTETFGNGSTGFPVLSIGNNPLETISDSVSFPQSKLSPDSGLSSSNKKYQTGNTYYGFTYERMSPWAQSQYIMYYLGTGRYNMLSTVQRLVSSKDEQDINAAYNTYATNIKNANAFVNSKLDQREQKIQQQEEKAQQNMMLEDLGIQLGIMVTFHVLKYAWMAM